MRRSQACEFLLGKRIFVPTAQCPLSTRCGHSLHSAGSRSLIKITLPAAYEDRQPVKVLVDDLMGRDPAKRFEFIQRNAAAVDEEAIDA